MPTDSPAAAALPPPWSVFPGLSPEEPGNQGAVEAFLVLEWLPFWSALTREDKDAYLDRWNASPAWRAAIAERYELSDADLAAEAEEARLREAEWRSRNPTGRWRLFGRKASKA